MWNTKLKVTHDMTNKQKLTDTLNILEVTRGEAAALGGDQGPYKENWSEAEVEPGSAKQSQHMKKSYPNQDATKKGRRLGREKQPPSKESTQETDLWDEAIVGSCY